MRKLLVFLIGFLLLSGAAFATTVQVNPVSAGTFTEFTPYPGPPNWKNVQDGSDATGNKSNVSSKTDTYVIKSPSIPVGATINSVMVWVRAMQYDGTRKVFKIAIIDNLNDPGHPYFSGNKTAKVLFSLFSNTWSTDPATGSDWTIDEVDNLEAGMQTNSSTNGGVDVSEVYVIVSYTTPVSPSIESWTQLNDIRNATTGNYYLTRSLLTSDVDYAGIGDSWTPIPTFTGTFNGNGYAIDGLICSASGVAGLFDTTSGSTSISSLEMSNPKITGTTNTGAIAGLHEGGTIINCYVKGGTVTGGSGIGGGIAGQNWASITNCYCTATVSSVSDKCGGLVGWDRGGTVTNCYAVGDVTSSGTVGGLIGYEDGSSSNYVNCGWYSHSVPTYAVGYDASLGGPASVTYNETDNTVFYPKTHGVYTGSPAWDFITPIWYQWTNSYPEFTTQPSYLITSEAGEHGTITPNGETSVIYGGSQQYVITPEAEYHVSGLLVDGGTVAATTEYTFTDVTADHTIKASFEIDTSISSWTQLDAIRKDLTGHYMLIRDLLSTDPDYPGIGDSWAPIGDDVTPFTGSFNGNGHSIQQLYLYDYTGDNDLGLFGVNAGIISKVGLINVNLGSYYGSDHVGALVGYNQSVGSITDCYAAGGVYGNNDVGGLIGYNDGSITNCYAAVGIYSNNDIGGLTGYNHGSITNCYAVGYIYGNNDVGGLAGYNDGLITNCGWWTGCGVSYAIGSPEGNVTYNETNGAVFCYKTHGVYNGSPLWDFTTPIWYEWTKDYPKLQAPPSPSISSWTQLNDIRNNPGGSYYLTRNLLTSDPDYAGIGDKWTPIGDGGSPFTGSFEGQGHTIDGLIIKVLKGDYLGLFGDINNKANISRVGLTNVKVTAPNSACVGGLVGQGTNSSIIKDCFVTGTITGQGYVGGLIGNSLSNTITNSYTTANVQGTDCVGGLMGASNFDTITNCYAVGDVTGDVSDTGGLIGYAPGSITINNCGWYAHGVPKYAIGNPQGNVTYNETIESWFYVSSEAIYNTQSPIWDFTTPIWYEWTNSYPEFTAQPPSGPTGVFNSISGKGFGKRL